VDSDAFVSWDVLGHVLSLGGSYPQAGSEQVNDLPVLSLLWGLTLPILGQDLEGCVKVFLEESLWGYSRQWVGSRDEEAICLGPNGGARRGIWEGFFD
jgi:hypothetical protein